MGLFLENGALTVNIANETRAGFRGHIHLAMCRGNLTVLDGFAGMWRWKHCPPEMC